MKTKAVNINKVNKFIHRKEKEKLANIREGYYSLGDKPRLEHVYKDRSWKSALSMDLKIKGSDKNESHWCWDKNR